MVEERYSKDILKTNSLRHYLGVEGVNRSSSGQPEKKQEDKAWAVSVPPHMPVQAVCSQWTEKMFRRDQRFVSSSGWQKGPPKISAP